MTPTASGSISAPATAAPTAATPGARFYVRVAAVDREKATMEWSAPVLVTAC